MPPTIAFILPALTTGGAERVLISLMNGLDRTKYAPIFITLNDRGEAARWIAPDIECHSLHNKNLLTGLPGLLRYLRSNKPDVIFTTMERSNMAVLALKPFLPKTAFIVREATLPSGMEHGTRYPLWVRKAYRFTIRNLYRLLYPHADLVISPSQRIIDELDSYLKIHGRNYALLPNPVDLLRTRGFTAALPTRALGELSFVAVGRLDRVKGFDRLIEALAEFRPAYPWQLTIYGEGPERPALEQLIRDKGLTGNISLPGISDNPSCYMAAADALLIPSRWEGVPNVLLEALSVGTPVIAPRDLGVVAELEALAGTDSVIAVEDMDELVTAMGRIKPAPVSQLRPSLLPAAYEPAAVNEKFSSLLAGVLTKVSA
jgi:glycosyltransferase involved in cell wall biosynthesis